MKDFHHHGKKTKSIRTKVIMVISVFTIVILIFTVFLNLVSKIPDSIGGYIIFAFIILFVGWVSMRGVVEYLYPGTDDLMPFWFEPDRIRDIENPALRILAMFFFILLISGPFLVLLLAVLVPFLETKDWAVGTVMIVMSLSYLVSIVFRIIKVKMKKRKERNKGKLPP